MICSFSDHHSCSLQAVIAYERFVRKRTRLGSRLLPEALVDRDSDYRYIILLWMLVIIAIIASQCLCASRLQQKKRTRKDL